MTPTILVVDDDPLIRKLIATTLEDVSGFELAEAGDGDEAVRVAAERRPAIVFLDVDMPRMGGIEACRAIRALPSAGEDEAGGGGRGGRGGGRPTIVMLTAAADDRAEEHSREAGADLFLRKPFSPLALLRLVDSLGTS